MRVYNNYKYSEEEQRNAYVYQSNTKSKKMRIEVPVFTRSVDLVIFEKDKEEITAIEFKLKNWKKAIEQALKITNSFDYILICFMEPKNEITKSLIISKCEEEKIGLIFSRYVNNIYEFTEIIAPLKQLQTWIVQKRRVLNFISEMK